MSIESKEIKDIYALYQNLSERTYAEVKAEREERIKNIKDPFRNTTIVKNGKNLKRGDEGFDKELDKGRDAVTKANNNSLKDNNSSSSSSSDSGVTRTVTKNDDGKGITVTKRDLDSETEDLISKTPTVKKSKFSGKTLEKSTLNKSDSSDKLGGTGTKTTYKDGKPDKVTKVDGPPDSFGGVKASSDEGKKLLNPDKEKVVRNRRGRVINNKGSLASTEKEKVVTKSDVGSDGLSAKNKRFTTKTVNVTNRRGRVTGTKEVRVQSQQSDGGKKITNRRGRVIGTTKPTDAEGKSFPSTAEIRAKAKADGGSGLSNIPSKEGNAVINNKPLNPDFGKKPVIQKDTPIKPEISAKQKWLDKTRNSPAAKSGAFSDDQRWAQHQKHQQWKKDNNRGEFATGKSSKEARLARRDARLEKIKMRGRPALQAKAKMQSGTPVNKLFNSYDPYDLVLNYLLETNQVDTIEEANYVMIQMDESTIQNIVNEYA
tara:strand:+ start:1626 stop:3083 length:1458 start_codon:yes stop_codon:yes gene_type:complete